MEAEVGDLRPFISPRDLTMRVTAYSAVLARSAALTRTIKGTRITTLSKLEIVVK